MHREVRAVAGFDRQHPHLLGGGLGRLADGDGGALLASGPRQRLEVAKLGVGVAGVKWMWALDDDGVDGTVHQPSLMRSISISAVTVTTIGRPSTVALTSGSLTPSPCSVMTRVWVWWAPMKLAVKVRVQVSMVPPAMSAPCVPSGVVGRGGCQPA